jgi:hypothetical protein
MGVAFRAHRGTINAYRILVWQTWLKETTLKYGLRCGWIHLAHDMDRQQGDVNTVVSQ